MKTKITTIAGIATVVLLFITSCKKDELITYEGKDQVYFYFASRTNSAEKIDSMIINLGYDNPLKPDSTIQIRAMIQGVEVDYDRPIHFTVVDSLSTAKIGEDIVPLYDRSYINANSVYGWIWIKIINTEKLSNTGLIAAIRTMPNEYFYADYVQIRGETEPKPERKRANTYWVYFNAKNETPNLWAENERAFTSRFGDYSRVKLEFMCEVLNVNRDYFVYDPETEDPLVVYNARFPAASLMGYVLMINRKLNQYEQEHGERLKDENGNEVKMGTTSVS